MADGRSSGRDRDRSQERLQATFSLQAIREEGFGDFLRARAWASALWLIFLWLLFTPILFAITGFVLSSFVAGVILGPLFALAAAGAIGHRFGFLEPLDRARRTAPLWVRLLVPIPIFVLAFALFFVVVGSLITNFLALFFAVLLLSLAATAGLVWMLGIWGDLPGRIDRSPLWVRLLLPVPLFAIVFSLGFIAIGEAIGAFQLVVIVDGVASLLATGLVVWASGLWTDLRARVRESTPVERLSVLVVVGILSGLAGSLAGLMVLEQAAIALALFLPSLVAGVALTALLLGWVGDARAVLVDLHVGWRLVGFAILLALSTAYFALLVGPLLPNATAGYTVAILVSLALLVPLTVWIHTWRDLWTAFVDLGEDRRLIATLPILPIAIAAIFSIIVVLTSSFEIAYTTSIPLGVLAFLLVGLPFGVTRDIPPAVRRQDLPARSAIFAAFLALVSLYAYFAIALYVQIVEVALVGGLAFGGLLLGVLVWRFDLGEGLGEEFESYGGPAEAAVLGAVFVGVLALTFTVIALTTGDFRVAFLVSVLVAAGANYLVAHSTGLVEGTREALAALPWWAELAVLSGIFVLAFLYGTIAIGSFLPSAGVSFALGALFSLAAVVALSRDLEIGDDVMETADEKKRARSVILVLVFLGGFMVGLYAAAAALQAVGVDLFGFPFFVGLLSGGSATLILAQRRGWDQEVLAGVRSTTDKLKVAVIVAVWLALGIGTGFAILTLPIDASVLGLGDAARLPLSITLAMGLLIWAWIPAALFRLTRVSKTPVQATISASEKNKMAASLGWGVGVFAVILVLGLVLLDSSTISVAIALAAGYLTALVFSILSGRAATES